ncbi:MAG TPA: 2-dehydropantoate 2-reductase N-terminal domain-containing protein [Verrucomicrobiae bacterium]|nr:2-dehydropantoate 2-reductase N-terminal domain-containing protein [Verrucomicrobiae bacterium]
MRIAVLGDGSIGNLIGGLLAEIGESVFIVSNDDMHINAITNQGLWIEGATGRSNAKLQAGRQLTTRPDILLLNTPIAGITSSLTTYQALLQDVPVLTLQNSPRAADYAASVLGTQYILSAAVLFGATVTAGHINYPVEGSMLVGEPFESTGFAEPIVTLLNSVVPTIYVDNIRGAHWTRLITSLHHGFAAATGQTAAQAAEDTTLRTLSVDVMKEAADLTQQKGIQLLSLPELPPINKIISILHMPSPVSDIIPRMLSKIGREEFAAELIVSGLLREGGSIVDHLNGEIIQLSKELGVHAPYNSTVVKVIKDIANTGKLLTPTQLLATVEAEALSALDSVPQNQAA